MTEARDPDRSAGDAAATRTPDRPSAAPTPDWGAARSAGAELFSDGELLGGRYRIVRLIGYGGMGAVYEAEDTELGERLALKALLPEVAAKANNLERFLREISLARKVTHPNVCRIYDVGHHRDPKDGDKITFLTMELLHGVTLSERLASGPLATEEAIPIACQIAAGLSAAHDAGVVHRDFKSSNIILLATSSGPRAVITDFGLSRALRPQGLTPEDREALRITGTGQLVGTPAYFAPEQLEGGEVTSATDVYAMGVVIYEMVTGVLPFTASTPFLTALKRIREPPTDPLEHVPGLDRRWLAVIDGCLERNPKKRFAHARDILGVLGPEYLSEIASTMITRSVIGYRRRRIRKRWLAAAAMVVLLGAAAYLHFGRSPPETLYVAVLEPEYDAAAEALGFIPFDLQVAVLQGLIPLAGLKTVDPSELLELEGGPQDIARAVDADEIIASRVAAGAAEWRIALRRIHRGDGSVLWAKELPVPSGDVWLLARAVAAALRQGYPERPPRPGVGAQEVESEDYAEFLRLYRTVESPPPEVDWESVLADLGRVRASAPEFLDAYLLEARVARFLYTVNREPELLERAFELIGLARKLAPWDPRPLFREVEIALDAGEPERAEVVLDELESLVPGDADILTARAQLAQWRGQPQEARQLMRQAVARRPTSRNFLWLADMELDNGEIEEARDHLEQVIELGNPFARARLAQLELEVGVVERAEELYLEIVERYPGAVELSNLGVTQLFLGKYRQAAESFRRSHELSPRVPITLLNLAESRSLLGDREGAAATYRQTLELIDRGGLARDAGLVLTRAMTLAHLGRRREAIEEVHEGLLLAGDDPEWSYDAALVYALVEEPSLARVNAERALELGISSRWFSLPWFDQLRADPEFQALLGD